MQPCNGGEKMQFYGTPQVATAAGTPYMAVDVLLSDTWPEGYIGAGGWISQVRPSARQNRRYQLRRWANNFHNHSYSISRRRRNNFVTTQKTRELYGVAVDTTPTTVNPVAGQFTINASELAINPQRWNAEPVGPSLGAVVTQGLAHISACEPLNLVLRSPSTPKGVFAPDVTVGVAGDFEVGYLIRLSIGDSALSTLTSGAGLLSEYSGPEIPLYSKNLLQTLNSLIDLFQKENTAGQTDVYIEVLTITTTAAPLYTNPKPVRGGTLMNLSSTDSITISSWGKGAMGKSRL